MQSTNIYKVKPILCFWSKICELAANGKDREWGRGGLATCVCNANEHGPPQLFLHCCAYDRGPPKNRSFLVLTATCIILYFYTLRIGIRIIFLKIYMA